MAADLVVVGGGRMGEALVGGLVRSGWAPPAALAVVEADPARRRALLAGLASSHPGLVVTDVVPECHGAVLAVKPADAEAACASLRAVRPPRVLSIAAGVPTATLERWLADPAAGGAPTEAGGPSGPVVVRSMPNTPALVGAGASAVAGGRHAGAEDLAWASAVLAAVGSVVTVPEALLDAVTGVSGSGPAYVFLLVEALIDAAVLVGLPRPTARDLAVQTLLGSARLLTETGETPEALRAAVTSPGGTTAAGLRALEAGGVRSAVIDAVVAATERSRQLGAS